MFVLLGLVELLTIILNFSFLNQNFLASLHHKFWFIKFSGVSAEHITINTNNSKSITGVSNGGRKCQYVRHTLVLLLFVAVRVVQTGSLVLFDLYVCIIVILLLYREGSLTRISIWKWELCAFLNKILSMQ